MPYYKSRLFHPRDTPRSEEDTPDSGADESSSTSAFQPDNGQPLDETLKHSNTDSVQNKKKKPSSLTAPIYDDEDQPYNYIIIIDAGSKGSRAYLYSWKSLKYHLNNNPNFKRDSKSFDDFLPHLIYEKQWHKRIKPSIESSIIEFGLHTSYLSNYLDHLIAKIYNIIPIEQHYRTPILFHATAGLRALEPTLQSKILDKICTYFNQKTDFYLPDCQTHINILDGDIEGLYSWITLNYLINNNGGIANHDTQTYGLLELGGGSAQICFQPSTEEIESHSIQLVNLQLNQNYQLFSTSFLGYGLNQFHHDYILYLIQKSLLSTQNYNDNNNNIPDADASTNNFNSNYNTQIFDPCSPTDYQNKISFNNHKYTLSGSSDFDQCIKNIYSVIGDNDEQCKAPLLSEDDTATIKTSKCMLSTLMPNFNLDKDNFIAISGYYDTVTQLFDFTNQNTDKVESSSVIYHPDTFIKTTQEICNMKFENLLNVNQETNLNHDEISNLCFKSTYITALLHSGYGLPLNDAEKVEEHTTTDHLLLNDKINDFKFSWTLGRALLYAYDETSREYYDFIKDSNSEKDTRIGYFRNSAPTLFHLGAEQEGIPLRPDFEIKETYPTFTFNLDNKGTKTKISSVQTTMDYYYDFDNGYDDDDDSNFDIDGDGDIDDSNEDDETELVYQPKNDHIIIKVLFALFSMFAILCVIPFTRNIIFKLFKKVKRKLNYYKSNQYSQLSSDQSMQFEEPIILDENLRKFHISDSNKKNTGVYNTTIASSQSYSEDTNQLTRDLELQNLNFQSSSSDSKSSVKKIDDTDIDIEPWDVDNNFQNDVMSEFDFSSDDNWDNDSDGIERAGE